MISYEELKHLYYDLDLSDEEIGKQYDVSRKTIGNLRHSFEMRSKRQIRSESLPDALTSEQEQMLVGSLMGDGHLRSSGRGYTARFELVHCLKQEMYFHSKMKILRPFTSKITYLTHNKPEGIFPMVRGWTHYSKVFAPYYDMFYWSGVRTFEKIWDKVGHSALAFWFFDDGNLEGNGFKISVSAKRRQDAIDALILMREKFGYKVTFREQYGDCGCVSLRVCKNSAEQFFVECLQPHITPDLWYKIPSFILDNFEPSLKRNLLEGVTTRFEPKGEAYGDNNHLYEVIHTGSAGVLNNSSTG